VKFKILVIGDIFGRCGRMALKKFLLKIKEENEINLVIANVENTTSGKGISRKHYDELKKIGIDIMTSGNHIFYRNETYDYINNVEDLLRPLNSNPFHPGKGSNVFEFEKKKIRVTNIIGTVFMPSHAENPFFALDRILEKKDWDIHLIDFHGESTAEKNSFALYYDGRVSAIWGTHTHVQTSDERILQKETAFITDIGMTGSFNGVIGADYDLIIKRAREGLPTRIKQYLDKKIQINGIILEVDKNNKISKIERLKLVKELI